MKYLYMDEQERQIQYYQFPKFLLELQLSQNARIIYMLLYDRARISRKNNWTDECGRVYVSGGTTHTRIEYPNESNPYQQERKAQDALKYAGANINYVA